MKLEDKIIGEIEVINDKYISQKSLIATKEVENPENNENRNDDQQNQDEEDEENEENDSSPTGTDKFSGMKYNREYIKKLYDII